MSLKVDLKSQEGRRGAAFDYGWLFVLIIILIAFVGFYFQGLRLQNVVDQRKQELQSWKDKVAGFSGIQGRLDTLKADIGSIQAQITQLRELRYDPLRYSILLVRLSKLLPENLWVGTMSIEPARNQVLLSGSAVQQPGRPPLASIAEFIRNLQNDKNNYFSDVVLQGTSSSGKTGDLWTFNMQTNYNVPLIRSGASASGASAPATRSVSPLSAPQVPSVPQPAPTATQALPTPQGSPAPTETPATPTPSQSQPPRQEGSQSQ